MNLTCTSRVIKYLLIVFNFLLVITGIILIGVGVSVKTVYSDYQTFLDDKYFSLPNMLIATGSIIFFVSLCGYCGAFKESWLFVGIFSVLLIVIFIFELSIGIAGYVLRDRTIDFLQQELKKNMMAYNESEVIVKKMWDIVQTDFKCCGVNSYKDWKDVFENGSLPISCCPQEYGQIGVFYCNANFETLSRAIRQTENSTSAAQNTTEPSITIVPMAESTTISPTPNSTTDPYKNGCVSQFGSYIKTHASDLAAAGMVLAVLQLLGVAFSFHLAKQLKNGYYST